MNRPLLPCQASIGDWEPGIRKGCPYISRWQMNFDKVLRKPDLKYERVVLCKCTHKPCSWVVGDSYAHLPSGFVSLAKNAKFLHLHVKYTPIRTKTHPLNALILHRVIIGKGLSWYCRLVCLCYGCLSWCETNPTVGKGQSIIWQ